MAENAIEITVLNDFAFCPISIYYHHLDAETDRMMYQCSEQLNGSAAHERIDRATYSTGTYILQGISVYSEQYNLIGKIDLFDIRKGLLTERKKKIKTVYDGYVYQLYAQCLSLREMGYEVKAIRLYSMDDNQIYPVSLPEESPEQFQGFLSLIQRLESFQPYDFSQKDLEKCLHCIYEPLCIYSEKKV